jgi:hypothetical protein
MKRPIKPCSDFLVSMRFQQYNAFKSVLIEGSENHGPQIPSAPNF